MRGCTANVPVVTLGSCGTLVRLLIEGRNRLPFTIFGSTLERSMLIAQTKKQDHTRCREVKLGKNSMLGFEVLEKLPCWPDLPLFRVLEALMDNRVWDSRVQWRMLKCFGILHHSRRFRLYRKHWARRFFELFT